MIPKVREQTHAPASVDMAKMEFAIPFSSAGASMTTMACIVGWMSPFPNPRRSPRQMIGAIEVQNLIPNMQISTQVIPIISVHLEPIPLVILPTVRRLMARVMAWTVKNVPIPAIPTVFAHVGRYVTVPPAPIWMKNIMMHGKSIGVVKRVFIFCEKV